MRAWARARVRIEFLTRRVVDHDARRLMYDAWPRVGSIVEETARTRTPVRVRIEVERIF